MAKIKDNLAVYVAGLVVIVMITFPYILANYLAGDYYAFNGFLLNPIDGNSYLSKMYQGFLGNWRFVLPYTADPGKGAYLFLFYIGLGHLVRVTGIPSIVIFHFFRIIGCITLLITLWWFFGSLFQEKQDRKMAFIIAALGSGMGWLLLPLGIMTSDFWVAEAYPFLSSFANPHFPISLSLLLIIIKPPLNERNSVKNLIWKGISSFALSLINPFGIVIVLVIYGGFTCWLIIKKKRLTSIFLRGLVIAISGLPFVIYDIWVTRIDPILSVWNTQNKTPSPMVWDLIFSLSPLIFLSILGIYRMIKNAQESTRNILILLVIWLGLGLALLYLPFNLQRRFMFGIYIPIAGLATYGLKSYTNDSVKKYRFSMLLILIAILPTNLIILMADYSGMQNHDPQIYLSIQENDALDWIKSNTDQDAVIVCSPGMGLYIPAYTGRRVVYGHPYETTWAEKKEVAVRNFYHDNFTQQEQNEFLIENNASYILIGEREQLIGNPTISGNWTLVYQSERLAIYRI